MAHFVALDDLDSSSDDDDMMVPVMEAVDYDKYPRTEELECM
jgi:hypothetical protein